MKKISKAVIFIVIALVILGLTLPLLKINAQENLQIPLKEVENKIDELTELKDDSALSDKEKEVKEIQVRKEALAQIADLSLLEIKNLENKINALELKAKDEIAIKEKFLEIFENNRKYSENLKKNIEKENLTLEEIKNLAQEYKDWRNDNYDCYVKKITVFILVFQEKQVLKIANVRLDKIMLDLKKLENARILKKEDTWNLINSSMKSLTNAQIFNNDAETIIIGIIKKYAIDTASSTPVEIAATTSEILLQNEKMASSSPVVSIETMASKDEISKATSTPQIISEEDKAQTLIEKSLKEIKNAYNNFISISDKVRFKLKIK